MSLRLCSGFSTALAQLQGLVEACMSDRSTQRGRGTKRTAKKRARVTDFSGVSTHFQESGVRCTSVLLSRSEQRKCSGCWQKMSLSTLTAQEALRPSSTKGKMPSQKLQSKKKLKTKHLPERECQAREMIKESEELSCNFKFFPTSPLPH